MNAMKILIKDDVMRDWMAVQTWKEIVAFQKYNEGRVTGFTVGLDVAWEGNRGINAARL